ncbi:SpvB/TcaC N-terminal domain-containing protein [Sorangium sp. So ce216]
MTSDRKQAAPSVSLPKGGGAIRGIGEKLGANPVTGTASMTVPLATSPGRSGFGPQLSLSYDSGAGNGPFGFGWSLALPRITRKTDRGLPRYDDAAESDVFVLSDAEDLVPVLEPPDTTSAPGFTIHRYRPRIEGPFARIERWTRADGDVHWRSISRDDVLTIYGKDANSRIADPADERRVFTWLICESRDDKGNAVLYVHKAEDGAGIDLARAHERNRGGRDDERRRVNRHIKYIRYGNRTSLLDASGDRPAWLTPEQIEGARWMFEVVFDYGEHDAAAPTPGDAGAWGYRADPFSSYRSGFEVRTGRVCRRVLMFHHFPAEEGVGADCLVRSTDFTYSHEESPGSARNPVYTMLRAVTHAGYRRDGAGYVRRALPPVEYAYTEAVVRDEVTEVSAASLENLPVGLGGSGDYQWLDLHGEGVPGILVEQGGGWFYKRNISPLAGGEVDFAPVERVALRPTASLAGGEAQLMDLAGDGQLDLVVMNGPAPGLFEHDEGEGWEPFRPFASRLHRDIRDPNLRLVDLDGDGRADVLVTENDAFAWHASLAEDGFGPAQRVHRALDEEAGPRLVFADGTQSIYLADLSGDGLTDLVRIRNGEICYWPNLGYGRFGAKITMDGSPLFDHPDQFDQARIRLADVDGSGTTDILYLHRDGVRVYFNQSGNGFGPAQTLRVFPRVDDLITITAIDLLGNGTACLVWSSPLPGDARRQMRYVDLMGGQKPHLLVQMVNNLGAETRLTYASSTKFYLQDRVAGRPWLTRLPFPVHVVERVETRDRVSGNRFVTRYAYHHGHYDGEEREFRGFGMVEQRDTEELAALTRDGVLPEATNEDAASHVPPVLTKTWFHTGLHAGRGHVSDAFAGLAGAGGRGEYYREPGLDHDGARARLLPDTVLPDGLTPAEEREACRALKGSMLRREVHALDGTDREEIPYVVTEQSFTIVPIQRRGGGRHAVFFTHGRETLHYHYERNPADPRVQHMMTLKVDPFGNVLESLTIGYGRRAASTDALFTEEDHTKQTRLLVTRTSSTFAEAAPATGHHRAPLPAEARTYELTGFAPEGGAERFSFDEWARDDFARLDDGDEIPYEQPADHTSEQRRLVEHVRTLYRADDLTALLPLRNLHWRALPGESYELALTPGLIAEVFRRRQDDQPDEDLLPDPAPLLEGTGEDGGGYVAMDGGWWIPSGKSYFDPAADIDEPANTAVQERAAARASFFQPRKVVDPFGESTLVDYDGHQLLVARTVDAADNATTAVNDYRVLQPGMVIDPNRNRTAVAFDALGMVVATAVMGKENEDVGDLLEGFEADPPLAGLQSFVASPHTEAASLLGSATTRIVYDLERYRRAGQPACAATLARETHLHAPGGAQTRVQVSFSYSDGFGREIQKKAQAEPGDAPERQAPVLLATGDVRPGDLVRDGQHRPARANAPRRWVGSGRTVYNNKGKPVRQYEPFFSATHLYEPERDMTDTGFSPVLFYDPLERVVATLHPNDTYEKAVFDPWRHATYDANDTVAAPAAGPQTGDPRTDPDIMGHVRAYFAARPGWNTWYAQRIGGERGSAESDAAQKAAVHADTPTVAHLDVLGRPFLNVTHNRYERNGAVVEQANPTRVALDIEGNQREVRDAIEQNGDERGRVVMRYDYDMLGNRLHQASMDAGERWTLPDVTGNPIRAWDSRRFLRRMTYDGLRRSTGLYVTEDGAERLAERTVYGEGLGDAHNHRTRVHQVFDGAGVVTSEEYDFKGNLLRSHRRFLVHYRTPASWGTNPALEDGDPFTSRTTYDALNRPLTVTFPDGSVYRASFNEASLLDGVDVDLPGAANTRFVTDIDYNAKGQRESIAYANGAVTAHEYDPFTFRLTRMRTTRSANLDATASQLFSDATVVQDLRYTYDPAGNPTRIEDASLKTVFRGGQQIEPVSHYIYDALYRLIEARGREHIGQTALDMAPLDGNHRDQPFSGNRVHPNDLQALRNYTERYEYDAVGNVEVLRHLASGAGWTRRYDYQADSLLEGGKKGNRLTRSTLGNGGDHVEPVAHDPHGNMTSMPHLAAMAWDFKDQLRQVDLGGGGTAYYICDARGQRARKVIESRSGTRREERLYLAGVEIYREYEANGEDVALARASLHVMDDQQRIALVETQTIEGGQPVAAPVHHQRYQLGGHLGSASAELDEGGALISYEEYHPFGTTAFQAGRSAAEVSTRRYRYTGKERDEETGLAYHGARYYAPWLARWTATDPIIDELDLQKAESREKVRQVVLSSLYEYCRNNPLKFHDPDGRDPSADQRRFNAIRGETGGNMAETLIRAFTDPGISGGTPQERFRSILSLTSNSVVQPVHFSDTTITGTGDRGFRRELRDSIQYRPSATGADIPLHPASSNQVGHFLTAADMGHTIAANRAIIAADDRFRREHPILSALSRAGDPSGADPMASFHAQISVYLRAMVGHELVPDGGASYPAGGASQAIRAPTSQQITDFEGDRLNRIVLNTTQSGNSYQDLYLTRVGQLFGQRMQEGFFRTNEEAARWLRIMLTDDVDPATPGAQGLSTIQPTDRFSQDAQWMSRMLEQFRSTQPPPSSP